MEKNMRSWTGRGLCEEGARYGQVGGARQELAANCGRSRAARSKRARFASAKLELLQVSCPSSLGAFPIHETIIA